MPIVNICKTAIIAASISAVGLPALADLSEGDRVGTTEAEMRAVLEAEGYDIIDVETEPGEIEFTARINGILYEIEASTETGQIIEIELEDDDDDDDDNDDDDDDDDDDT